MRCAVPFALFHPSRWPNTDQGSLSPLATQTATRTNTHNNIQCADKVVENVAFSGQDTFIAVARVVSLVRSG